MCVFAFVCVKGGLGLGGVCVCKNLIRGEPERAPNTRETYGNFAVPMYVSM